jgi:hypothetical protein
VVAPVLSLLKLLAAFRVSNRRHITTKNTKSILRSTETLSGLEVTDSLLRGSSVFTNASALLPISGVNLTVALFELRDLRVTSLHSSGTGAVGFHTPLTSSSSRLEGVVIGFMASLFLGFDLLIEGRSATIILLLSYDLGVSNTPAHTAHSEMCEDFVIVVYIH